MPAAHKQTAPVRPDFEATFSALKALLRAQVPKALVIKDVPGDFQVASSTRVDRSGRPLFLAAVQIKKSYVSFHLMPVYAAPKLVEKLSPSLRKRMQGKGCFNFSTIEPAHLNELGAITKVGAAALERIDLPWAKAR
jgi:hypothetical protein